MDNSLDELVDLTQEQKTEHIFKVMCEWPSTRAQLRLENIYDPKSGINLGDKFWTNQQFSALKVYNKLDASTEDILEKILEREGTLDLFSTETSSLFPNFSSNSLNEIEKELECSARNHSIGKEHRYQIQLLKQGTFGCITDLWDEMSSSTEYNFMFQKYKAMTVFEFLDKYPLPTNSKEVEEQSSGRIFRFLHSLHPARLQSEVRDSLNCANSFWNLPDIKRQLENFIDEWAYDRKLNNRYCFGFVDCLIELMWIRERMLAAKNMNASKQNIFWDRINLKHESHVRWLLNEAKNKPSCFLNILRGTVHQLTENNESENIAFTLEDYLELEFKAWLCICEHEYLKLLNVTLFEKLIDHNLIYDHDSFVIQEIINSGMLMIILAILKLFIDDRNSFSHEQWEKLHQIKSQPFPKEESVITQSNEEVKTDDLRMTLITTPTVTTVITQSNEEVKTDDLCMTLTTTPTECTFEIREIENTGTNTEELSLQNTKDNEKETTPSNIQTDDSEGRSKLCTRVLNETTLRIFCQRKSNTETFTHEFDIPITSPFISIT